MENKPEKPGWLVYRDKQLVTDPVVLARLLSLLNNEEETEEEKADAEELAKEGLEPGETVSYGVQDKNGEVFPSSIYQ